MPEYGIVTPRRYTVARNYAPVRRTAVRAGFRVAKYAFNKWRQSASRKVKQNNNRQVSQSASRPLTTTHTSSAGSFAKGKRLPLTLNSAYSKSGFVQDWTVGGRVQDPDCVYIGHTDVPCDTTLFTVCAAMTRSICRLVDLDVEDENSVIPFVTDWRYITIIWIDSSNTPNSHQIDIQADPSTTVDYVASQLFSFFRSGISSNSKRTYQRLILTDTAGTGSAARVSLNLFNSTVDFCNTSYLKVQNSTQSAASGGGNTDTDDVNAVPLEGFSYFGKGNYTGLKPYTISSKNADNPGLIPYEITSDSDRGLMVFRRANAAPSLYQETTQPYKNPPPARQMKNVSRSGFASLEPGNIKTDKIETQVKMKLNQFLQSIYVPGWVNTVNPNDFGQYNRSRLGHFKLFALEKKLYSNNQDQVQVRYEIQQFIRARVYLPKHSEAMVRNVPKELRDYIPA